MGRVASSKPNCWCIEHSIYNRWDMKSTLWGSGKPAPGSLQGNSKTGTRRWRDNVVYWKTNRKINKISNALVGGFWTPMDTKKFTQFLEHRSMQTYAYSLPRTHIHARTPWHTYMHTHTIYYLQGFAQNSLWESAVLSSEVKIAFIIARKEIMQSFCLELSRCSLLCSPKWETVICWLSSHLLLF